MVSQQHQQRVAVAGRQALSARWRVRNDGRRVAE
jgi:hypothetical protein